MGLAFVLLIWGIVGGFVASIAAATLVAGVWFVGRRKRPASRRWFLIAAVFPFVSLGYEAVSFIAYAVHCELVRDVDMGVGDSWRVPLGNGYRLVMIDTPDQAFVQGPGDRSLPFPLKRIGRVGDLVVGEDDEGGFFAIDTRGRTERKLLVRGGSEVCHPAGDLR